MKQIVKPQVTSSKQKAGNVKKKNKAKIVDEHPNKLPKMAKPTKAKRKHPKFGTSKLEIDFAKNFLDKLGVKYIWQFEAKEIKRFYDYYLPKSNILIEIDGDYWHSYGLVRENMNPTQKKNARIDKDKDTWAALHGIPLVRIWEHDIRKNPGQVMKMLKEKVYLSTELENKKKEKNKRHVNRLDQE